MIFAALALGAGLLTAQAASSQSIPVTVFLSGNDVLRLCRHSDATGAPVACSAYVAGLIEGWSMGRVGAPPPGQNAMACWGPMVTPDQLAETVLHWLLANPEARSEPGPQVVYSALNEAYPCR